MNCETLYYIKPDGTEIPTVRNEEDGSLWMSAQSVAQLFCKDRSWVLKSLRSVVLENRFRQGDVVRKMAQVVRGGRQYDVDHYRVDIVLASTLGKGTEAKEDFGLWAESQKKVQLPEIIRYHADNLDLDIRFSAVENTCWLTQNQMAMLFGTTRQNIALHLTNLFADEELNEGTTCKDFLHVLPDGREYMVAHYNLDAVLAEGYRVNSARGIEFRKWATKVLGSYIRNGYAIDKRYLASEPSLYIKMADEVLALRQDHRSLDERVQALEHKTTEEPFQRIFFAGKLFDPSLAIQTLLKGAKSHIVIVDPYFDAIGLSFCEVVDPSVSIDVYTAHEARIKENELQAFMAAHGPITVHRMKENHDRYVIIDDTRFYHLGASLNFVGKLSFGILEIESDSYKAGLISILANEKKK